MPGELEQARGKLFARLRREFHVDRVVDAMEKVPRELFVPEANRHLSYEDIALPIEMNQTISQPSIVALMTQALELKENDRVLELGTGNGYQAAVLSLLAKEVYSVERVAPLAKNAIILLDSLTYSNVWVRQAGNMLGCPEEAPFDGIMVTAASPRIPSVLLKQMAEGGRLVIPVGSLHEQSLLKVVKTNEGFSIKNLGPCRFVPLLGRGAWERPSLTLGATRDTF